MKLSTSVTQPNSQGYQKKLSTGSVLRLLHLPMVMYGKIRFFATRVRRPVSLMLSLEMSKFSVPKNWVFAPPLVAAAAASAAVWECVAATFEPAAYNSSLV